MGSEQPSNCSNFNFLTPSCDYVVWQFEVWHIFLTIGVFLVFASIVWIVRWPNRFENQRQILKVKTPYGASPENRTMRLHPLAMANALKERGYEDLAEKKREAAKKLNEKYSDRYFVVTIREGGRTLVSKELKVIAWPYRVDKEEFQLDPDTLAKLKIGSASKLDDELGDRYGADGEFDVFFRKVRWWDLRHWLNHPAREIRYAIYVAFFATALEYSGDVIQLMGHIF